MVTILKIYCAIVMKRRNDQTRWHVQRNCWESLGLMEAEYCATCRLGTRLGYSSTASTAGCPIRCRQTDRWCLVRDFKAENDLCFLPPPPPPQLMWSFHRRRLPETTLTATNTRGRFFLKPSSTCTERPRDWNRQRLPSGRQRYFP